MKRFDFVVQFCWQPKTGSERRVIAEQRRLAKEAADAKGVAVSKDESREAVYGMPYEEWKAKFQGTATPEQLAAMKKVPASFVEIAKAMIAGIPDAAVSKTHEPQH